MTETAAPPLTYSATAVCELASITYRKLDYWVRAGHVDLDPEHETARTPGSGMPRRFSEAEMNRLVLLARLDRAGLRIDRAAIAIRAVRGNNVLLAPGVRLVLED